MAARRRAAPAPGLAWADAPERQVKMLGSLPVIYSICRRLDIAGVIDDLVPIRDVATVSAGQAIEAMICNRLTSPALLVHVGDWARDWAVPEVLGIPAPALNDDKLGRTLDVIAPKLEEITGAGRHPRDRRLRHRHHPDALGHDQLLAARRLRASR